MVLDFPEPKVGEVLEPDIKENKFYCDAAFFCFAFCSSSSDYPWSHLCRGGDIGMLKM